MEFIHYLFEDYARRGLTKNIDKSIAISGLESRIAGALQCEHRYGIFQRHFHRNLLWLAIDTKMERIVYDSDIHVPSWSWMAYNGNIRFFKVRFGSVSWIQTLHFDECCKWALVTNVGEITGCTKVLGKYNCTLLYGSGRVRGWIRYDTVHCGELDKERCVVVGRKSEIGENDDDKLGARDYFILVVKPTTTDAEYERVGFGLVESGCVVKQRSNVRLV